MASKKRRYGSLPATHRIRAIEAAQDIRLNKKDFEESLRRGNCRGALMALTDMRFAEGHFRAQRRSITDARRGPSGITKAAAGAERRFMAKCLWD